MISRREFINLLGYGTLATAITGSANPEYKRIPAREFQSLPSPDYHNISHSKVEWENISKGLYFSRTEIYRENELVDIIAALSIDPEYNSIRVLNGFSNPNDVELHNIAEWQSRTKAIAMINSAQYMADPPYMPCALVICDGRQKGPKYNRYARGMLVAEPRTIEDSVEKADLLDFDYDKFDYKTTPYTQGVQHWPILLDRQGSVKVKPSLWQANRTVVAKTFDKKILFLTTEGGFFTLFNLGRFFKESNQRKDHGLNIHTAMNMDGGYEADMVIKAPNLEYLTYGEFETYGLGKDATIHNMEIEIPGVIGVFRR